jgi:indolepyruvate ferredoxin oxidoreductase beta subunit
MTHPTRLSILVAALGGQGGGVLTDWIVQAARAEGVRVQATSTPGVSQRTGATTYYVELARGDAGRAPVLGLAPMPGRVDVLVCAELLEAARMLERGFCTPSRTSVVASTHRVYTTREKMGAGDARFDAGRIADALASLSSRAVLFDMDAIARRMGAAISAALFGALAGSGALPLSRRACEYAIAGSGKSVTTNLLAFGEAFAQAKCDAQSRVGASASHAAGEAAATAMAQPSRLPPALAARIDAWPVRVAEFARIGAAELIEYQGVTYASTYVDRVERALAVDDVPDEVARETARYLALWMRYDDLIRVASRKARRERFTGIRREAGAGEDDVVRVYDFFKPGALEVAAILPTRIGAWLEERVHTKRVAARPTTRKRGGVTLEANSIRGALALRLLAALRPIRPHSLRFAREQQAIDAWLDCVVAALRSGQREGALDLARLPRLIRGYGDTHAGGRASFDRILAAWRAAASNDVADAARALKVDAEAAFNGTGCSPAPKAFATAARSAAASSRA